MKMFYTRILSLFIIALLSGQFIAAQNTNVMIHEKYKGTIVFAEYEINFENIDDGILKDHFRLLNTIYGRIFLEKPLGDYYNEYNWVYDFRDAKFDYNYSIDIYIDGQKVISWFEEMLPEAFNKYMLLDIVIAPSNRDIFQYSLVSSDWVNAVSGLSEGKHYVKVEMKARNIENPGLTKDPVAAGEFTLNVEKSKIDEFKSKFSVGLPQPTVVNEKIEEGVLLASINLYGELVPMEAIIVEPTGQLQYRRDIEGNILSRNFVAAVALKSPEGECFVKTARYFQDHKGNFQFGNVRLSEKLEGYYNYRIPCENIE